MHIYRDLNNVKISNPYVTIGTFDGVHLGHQHIFRQLIKEAKANSGQSVVITFWPHPRTVLNSKAEVSMINTIEEKIELIEKQGIEHFIILPFTKELANLSSKEFISQYLCDVVGMKGLIVGYDHKFGKDRQGDFGVLKGFAEHYGFQIKKVDALFVNNKEVSSTEIRNAIIQGQIEKANSFLSRNFTVSGKVIGGKQIGRNLGFPTANIQSEYSNKLIPKEGVYAVKLLIDNKEYAGMLNIGYRPTVNNQDKNQSIEVHIINYNGDLYGQCLKLYFHKRIRDEKKFDSLEQLIAQLKDDKEQIINFFNKN